MKIVSSILLAAALSSAQGFTQANKPNVATQPLSYSSNECFAKGGIGVIRTDLYVDVKSGRNELVLGAGKRWIGHGATAPQVIVFFQQKIWSPQALPDGFDLSKAVVVSFESDKVRFFDFDNMSGGYYRR